MRKRQAGRDFVIPPHRTLAEIERMAILQTLQRTNWNKQEAAQILGLYRPTLYSKMKKHCDPGCREGGQGREGFVSCLMLHRPADSHLSVRLSGLSCLAWFLRTSTNSNNLTYAASIAYYALLSLFPFSMLALAVLGAITADDADRSRVLNFVLRFFPTQFEFITRQLDDLRASPLSFGVAGTLGLVWGALGVFGAISLRGELRVGRREERAASGSTSCSRS